VQIERLDKRDEIVDVVGQSQRSRLEVTEAAAEVVGRHAAIFVALGEDEPSPVERPRGVAVDEQ
jgi:hypothetical protein